MDCPKCSSEMEFATLNNMRVDRCLQCFGIWFRETDHQLLKRDKDADRIDVGPVELGQDFNSAENVPCPTCRVTMQRTADKNQPHIHYEMCLSGHGVFFDAGEFRDYKEKSLGDFFKRITA